MDPASCLHSLLSPPRSTAITSRLRSSQILPKIYTRTKRYCSFIQYGLTTTSKPAFLPCSLFDYLSYYCLILYNYDHIIMYVGLIGHSAVVFHVFMFFSCFSWVLLTLCVVVLYQWHFVDLFNCIAASLFNKLTYLLTLLTGRPRPEGASQNNLQFVSVCCPVCSLQ